jgi:hypothetical protein
MRLLSIVLVLLALCGSVAGARQAPAGAAEARLDAFHADLARALTRNDRRAVAAMVQYPITLFAGGVRVPIADPAAEVVFTPALVAAFNEGDTREREGLIEAGAAGSELKITRITLPAPRASATTPNADGGRAAHGTVQRTARQPTRILFRAGQRTAQFSGTLERAATNAYAVFVPKGQILEVRVDRVTGLAAVARVFDMKSGEAVDASAAEGARRWIGRPSSGADYRVDVVRLQQGEPEALAYTLVVTLR